jgi:hypothetical protein
MIWDALGWILIVVACIFVTLLVLHVESEKKLSYKFTITAIVVISLCLGYGINFFLVGAGF